MQRCDLCVKQVAAVEGSSDRREPNALSSEFDGHVIELTELAVEIKNCARLPLVGVASSTAIFQQRYFTNKHAIVAAPDTTAALIR